LLTCRAASLVVARLPAGNLRIAMGSPPGVLPGESPAEGRCSVSSEQRDNLDAILRQSAFPAGGDVNEQRRLLRELVSAQPLPADVTVTAAALGGVPTEPAIRSASTPNWMRRT
jgi:hypothetical protein